MYSESLSEVEDNILVVSLTSANLFITTDYGVAMMA